ncbi:MAG TPA: translation elongation factor Ts, partial [Alphaproteobacteria bacterium]|nr:translation elongation factor Ts [Alphaproteobacteria bacterium]
GSHILIKTLNKKNYLTILDTAGFAPVSTYVSERLGFKNVVSKQLAMHVAAAAPQAVEVAGLDPAVVEHERNVLSEQARESGKPEEVVAKMVEGRLRKFYAESVLLEQVFVIDGETKVANVVEQAAADLGSKIKVSGFCRFALGEGIEKRSEDFAAEVAAAQGG